MENVSLFERLGGSDGIRAIVDDVTDLHLNNPVIKARFQPFAEEKSDQLPMLKTHLSKFLEMGSGGPGQYTGRSMPDAHRGMNVSEAEYTAAVDDIMTALRKHGCDEQTQKDVLAICFSLRGEIVGV